MKVVYFSSPYFADCDFPLVKEMQERGIDVRYYIHIPKGFKNGSILEFEESWNKWGIYKASKMENMQDYKGCVDLDRLFFISGYTLHFWDVTAWILWVYVMIHILCQRASVFHITWQLKRYENFVLRIPFRGKKIMTVHDPLQHSGTKRYDYQEKLRRKCFQWADEFILLNKVQVDAFCAKYGISKDRVTFSHLGVYNSILHFHVPESKIRRPYIMFFGQVNPNKGVEFLCQAMVKVHKKYPELTLLIAGKGNVYFDATPFTQLDYIIWENRFIGIKELVSYVRGSLFAVCPYKDATQSGVVQTAFALGTPVIATDVGGLPAAVNDGVYGVIIPPCDDTALADSICELYADQDKRKSMADNLRNKWMEEMSWEPIAADYLSVYRK